jgi:signal peptidase II
VRRVALIGAIVGALDQLTKFLVPRLVEREQSIVMIPGFFNLVNWHNPGAAWGIFQDYNLLLAIVSSLAILALYFFRHTFQLQRKACAVALGLIIGGIIGNLIDRVRLHHVVDFLDFYIGRFHWPAFNVADSAICIGVLFYIIASWRLERAAARAQPV